jgi:hypothetical protein
VIALVNEHASECATELGADLHLFRRRFDPPGPRDGRTNGGIRPGGRRSRGVTVADEGGGIEAGHGRHAEADEDDGPCSKSHTLAPCNVDSNDDGGWASV